MTYINAVKRIAELPDELPGGIERLRSLLAALGSPQKQLRFVHVTGDLGKNSCAEMMSSILLKSGYSVGSYSLLQTGELRDQIKIDGKPVPHAEFADCARIILSAASELFGEARISKSDLMLLVSILCFEKVRCAAVILERTMSGNDSMLPDIPVISVIASVTDRNGDTSFKEIIHRGTHETITSIQHKNIYSEISDACAEVGCRLTLPIYADLEVKKISLFKTVFTYRGNEYSLNAFSPCQLINAITALEAVQAMRRLGGNISDEAIAKGLSGAQLPLKCKAIAIDPTIIVATAEDESHVESLAASLAQVSDLIHGDIRVYLSPSAKELAESVRSRLASCSLNCSTPAVLPPIEESGFSSYIKELIYPITHSESQNSTTVFLGDNRYIAELSTQIQKNLGNI